MNNQQFQDHKIMLCLAPELREGCLKLMLDRGLDRSYAGLLPYVEGLYHMGYINKEVHDFFSKKYSQPKPKTSIPISAEEQNIKKELDKTDRIFRDMLVQYTTHSLDPSWILKVTRYASLWKDRLESARQLLAKIDAQNDKSTIGTAENHAIVSTVDKPETNDTPNEQQSQEIKNL